MSSLMFAVQVLLSIDHLESRKHVLLNDLLAFLIHFQMLHFMSLHSLCLFQVFVVDLFLIRT